MKNQDSLVIWSVQSSVGGHVRVYKSFRKARAFFATLIKHWQNSDEFFIRSLTATSIRSASIRERLVKEAESRG